MKHLMKAAMLLAFIALLVAGCGGPKKATTTTSVATENVVQNVPPWFTKLAQDPNYYFGKGTATSRDMQSAIDKANQAALDQIGQAVETKFDGLRKTFREEVGTADESQYLEQFSNVTKRVVSQVLNSVQEENSQTLNEQGVFRVYIVLRMPVGATLEALKNQISQQEELYTRFQSSKAQEELNTEIEKYQQWKQEQGH
ncbi:MAG: hypothetical protein V2A56_05935 [bacterium]